jgi:hypothetical protein
MDKTMQTKSATNLSIISGNNNKAYKQGLDEVWGGKEIWKYLLLFSSATI